MSKLNARQHHRGMTANQPSSVVGLSTAQGLANLAVRVGTGCPRERLKKARK